MTTTSTQIALKNKQRTLIRQQMKKLGLTQKALSKELYGNENSLYSLISSKSPLSFKTINLFSSMLNIPIQDLTFLNKPKNTLKDKIKLLCAQKGISYSEFFLSANIDHKSASYFLAGKKDLSPLMLTRLNDTYNMNIPVPTEPKLEKESVI